MRLLFLVFLSYAFLNAGGVLDIKWPVANKSHQKPSNPYPEVLVNGTKNVRLPVYLSSSYAYDKKMSVVSDKDFYSISLDLNGVSVLFEGDRTYQSSVAKSNVEFQKIVQKSESVEFSTSEEIMMATFNRHGANYAISVECDKPKTDKRCTKKDFVRELYQRIVWWEVDHEIFFNYCINDILYIL
jgi:hypothetical protein